MAGLPPTQGQNANVVGKFYRMSPSQFSSPEEYTRARDAERDRWRDSLRTREDYQREIRELMPHVMEGDRFQQSNARTAVEILRNDAQANGITLDPQYQQAIDGASRAQNSPIFEALMQRGRGTRSAAQQRPGQAAARQNQQPVHPTSNNVAISGCPPGTVGPYSSLRCGEDQRHHIIPDQFARVGTRGSAARPGMPSLRRGPSICLNGHAGVPGTEHNRVHNEINRQTGAIGNDPSNPEPGMARFGQIRRISVNAAIRRRPECAQEIRNAVDQAFPRERMNDRVPTDSPGSRPGSPSSTPGATPRRGR